LAEIRDGIFYATVVDGRLRLRPDRVPVALGLLLAEDAVNASFEDNAVQAVERAIATLVDDLPASDRVEIILRTAAFAVLALPRQGKALWQLF
jgi:hypothetical protein